MQRALSSKIIETESALDREVNRAGGSFNRAIHGLRGLAAVMVFVFHVFDMARKVTIVTLPPVVEWILGAMPAGVDIFFMISGYLIMGSLVRHANVRTFLLDRAVRIYPVFLFLHVLLFALAPFLKYKMMVGITPSLWIFYFVTNLLFLPGIFNLPLLQLNAWSLSYEVAFYLLSAAVYKLWPRYRILALILLFGLTTAFIACYGRPVFFVIGASIFFLLRSRLAGRIWNLQQLGIPGAVGFLGVMSYALIRGHIYWLCLALPFAFFFFLDVVRQTSALSAMLTNRLMHFLGTISYSLYLWHPVVTFSLRHPMMKILLGKLGFPASYATLIFGLAALAVTLPISWISWRVLEQEAGKVLKRQLAVR